MSVFKFFCPECGQKIACDASFLGSEFVCPTCQKSVVAPPLRAKVSRDEPAVPIAALSSAPLATSAPSTHKKEPSSPALTSAKSPTVAAPGSVTTTPRALALSYPYLAFTGLAAAVWSAFGFIPIIILIWALLAFLPTFCACISNTHSRHLATLTLKTSCFGLGLLLLYLGVTNLAKLYYAPKIVVRESPAELGALNPRIVDEIFTGIPKSEQDHQLGGKNLLTGPFNGKFWRSALAGGSITYVMKVLPDQTMSLNCRYWGGEQAGRTFDISIDDQVIATQNLEFNVPGHFFDSEYKIPRGLTRGKTQVTVKFQARPGLAAGGLFGCQILKR